jgi:uncharacterized lipoprotein YmbA
MLNRFLRKAEVCLITFALAGCASTPSRFYTLDATAHPGGTPLAHHMVTVGPVTIPASVDQPQFVTQAGPNQVSVDEFNRWASPLNDNIARVVAQNLSSLLVTPDVATGPLANFVPDYIVAIDVQRFESMRGQGTRLEAVWTVRRTVGGTTRSGRTSASETVTNDSFDALAAAHSRAIAMLSGDIASAIRSEDEAQPEPP